MVRGGRWSLPDDLEQARARIERIVQKSITCVPIAQDTILEYGTFDHRIGTYHLLKADARYASGTFLCAAISPGELFFVDIPKGMPRGFPSLTKAGFYDTHDKRISAIYLLPEHAGHAASIDVQNPYLRKAW